MHLDGALCCKHFKNSLCTRMDFEKNVALKLKRIEKRINCIQSRCTLNNLTGQLIKY